MPSKSLPLDVLPCSLLKSCAHVFSPAIARLANLSLQTGKFPARYKRAQVLPLLKKAGFDSSQPANYRPISNLLTVSKVLQRLVMARLRPICSALPTSASSSLHTQKGTFHRDCTTGGPGLCLHGGRRQAGHCPDWLRSVGSLRHCRPPAPPRL